MLAILVFICVRASSALVRTSPFLQPVVRGQVHIFEISPPLVSWLGGAVVTHPLWVQEVMGSIPGSGKGFYVWFFVLLLFCFYFFVKNTLFVTKVCNSFYNVNLFSILYILQDLWPIIRVKRYRPSIFNNISPSDWCYVQSVLVWIAWSHFALFSSFVFSLIVKIL